MTQIHYSGGKMDQPALISKYFLHFGSYKQYSSARAYICLLCTFILAIFSNGLLPVSQGNSKYCQFSNVVVLICTPTSGVWKFLMLYNPPNT